MASVIFMYLLIYLSRYHNQKQGRYRFVEGSLHPVKLPPVIQSNHSKVEV